MIFQQNFLFRRDSFFLLSHQSYQYTGYFKSITPVKIKGSSSIKLLPFFENIY